MPDTDTKPIEGDEIKVATTTPVLSNTEEDSKKKEEETRQHNRENALRRLNHKEWQKKVSDLTESPELAREAVRRAAERHGFKTDDEGNAKQIDLVADALHEHTLSRERQIKETKRQAATETLSSTLKELDYDPSSEEFKIVGNILFQRFGIDNPDVYGDPDRMRKELEDLTSRITRTKKKDAVTDSLVRKASLPAATTESRSASSAETQKVQSKKVSSELGVSEAKASKLAEMQAKLPARYRR